MITGATGNNGNYKTGFSLAFSKPEGPVQRKGIYLSGWIIAGLGALIKEKAVRKEP